MKNAWPRANKKVLALILDQSGLNKNSIPLSESGSIKPLITNAKRINKSIGIRNLLAFSKPPLTPESIIPIIDRKKRV